jgi:YjbE family integral membrane protein
VDLNMANLAAAANIVFIDLLLAGDNAVLIALAVRRLSPRETRLGIFVGAGAAVLLRVVLTLFATQLMQVPFLKMVGGALVIWIAVKLLTQAEESHGPGHEAQTLLQAMWMVVVADLTMSLDNVLAIAGASHGRFELIVFGLLLSIPLVVFASSWLSGLMARYPWIVIIGAAILGWVGGEMILTDGWISKQIHVDRIWHYAIPALAALAVVAAGKWLMRKPVVDSAV